MVKSLFLFQHDYGYQLFCSENLVYATPLVCLLSFSTAFVEIAVFFQKETYSSDCAGTCYLFLVILLCQ